MSVVEHGEIAEVLKNEKARAAKDQLDELLPRGDSEREYVYNQTLLRYISGNRDPEVVAIVELIEGLKSAAAVLYDVPRAAGEVALRFCRDL